MEHSWGWLRGTQLGVGSYRHQDVRARSHGARGEGMGAQGVTLAGLGDVRMLGMRQGPGEMLMPLEATPAE